MSLTALSSIGRCANDDRPSNILRRVDGKFEFFPSVFDPLHLKELPGNILVRGAIVQGYDPRPPYGIEVKVTANQIRAVAME